MINAIRATILGFSALFAAAVMAPASAETLAFKANLLAVAGTNSTATGTLTADFDTATKKLTWKGSYAGVGTYATSGAIYGAGNVQEVKLRTFDSPFEGDAILSDKQEADLAAGRWLIIIRTAGFPNGELGGKIGRGN